MLNRHKMVQSTFLGCFIGVNAALPMYLWQSNTQIAVACFIIVGYTSWLVSATWSEIMDSYALRTNVDGLPVNRTARRLRRLSLDMGFWWSLMFGGATVTGSVWYAGFRQMTVLVTVGVIWSMVAFLLNFGLTLLTPTTRCRKCAYELAPHMDPARPEQVMVCPECGTAWKQDELLLGETTGKKVRKKSAQKSKGAVRKAA